MLGVALPSPSVLEGSVTEAASYIMGGGSSQPIAMAAAPTLTADDAASAMLPVNGSHPVCKYIVILSLACSSDKNFCI